MKAALLLIAVLAPTSLAFAQSYVSPLRITDLRRADSLLSWTNQIGANIPVYEVLRTTTVTGNWQHFFFVTNARSTTLTNSASAGAPAVFHKLQWSGDTPLVFSYEFDEGNGLGPCISGQITVSLLAPGVWNFNDDGFCLDGTHVTGSGTVRPRVFNWTTAPHTAEFDLTSPPNSQFLAATLQSTTTNSTFTYVGMTGTVYQNGVAGPTAIGTFQAHRIQ